MDLQVAPVNHRSPPEAKVALFQSLFRGRDDVYPVRYENRTTGHAGFQPACGNEWVRGICEKPRIKCLACAHQQFLRMTDDVIRSHLSGVDESGRDFALGVYPMLRDETCFLLAIDLNKTEWQMDGRAIVETCQQMGLEVGFERSRSGNGGHIWLFFEQAVPATLARKLAAYILTETMERRPEIGLDSYDRFVPNQDTLPHGGFGSWIALPLQKLPRELARSVFLDELDHPYVDQWAFLSRLQKIARSQVETLVEKAQKSGRIVGVRAVSSDESIHANPSSNSWWSAPVPQRNEPPISGGLPQQLELRLDSQIVIDKCGLPAELRNRLIRLAAFQNPEFSAAQSMRLPTYQKPRVISCAQDHAEFIGLPRGCLDDVQQLLKRLKIGTSIRDTRQTGQRVEFQFQGELRAEQISAVNALVAHDMGILSATTAFGKTVVAAWLIAQRGVNVLILVHRRQLLEQWVERLSSFLGLPAKAIGRIGGGRKKPTGQIDVAVIQSLIHDGQVANLVENYGHLIVDECHHLSARSFEQVIRKARAKYILGLTATMTRKDGHHPIIFMQCGPIRHRVDALAQAAARPFVHTVFVRPTGFNALETSPENVRIQFQELFLQIIANPARNQAICDEVVRTVHEGRFPLVLTERNEHLDNLAQQLSSRVQRLIVLRGGMSRKAARNAMAELAEIPADESRVLLATGSFIGEGFDDPRLDTLFLTLPVSWHGTIAQYVGRLHRLHDQKRDVRVYDYADLNVPMLSRMFDRRCRGYEAVGYQIQIPASAVPGWPPDVPLPVDPTWKDAYATTVRRLCRDGVTSTLAQLFVDVTQASAQESAGVHRARSASEAFLFQRLETLPQTCGRFQLNAELPIPFDERGSMEVDLLCTAARLVIELDGSQHLETADAYRRDRRKDQLLQEQGYFILRFLSQDVGVRLEWILDAILRALSHRQQRENADAESKPVEHH